MSKRLPPLNALRVFDAAARHLSFTRAADELFVTQAAVSHQIKSLEDFLGLKLFRRRNRSLLLTEEGQSYFQDIKEIFSQLTEATRKLQARSAKGALTVSLLPSFAIQWLVPRLTSFNSAYPGIDVRIQAVDRQEDKLADDVDVAIFYGRGNWPGLRVEKLYAEYLLPVCSPLLLTGDKALKTPADLAQHTLLHDASRRDWQTYTRQLGLSHINVQQGPIFSHSAMVLQAAIHGQGVALANNGAEESKGTPMLKEAHQLLKTTPGIRFVGNIEPRDVPGGEVDVVVCDGFTGNVILKLTEGVAKMLLGMLKQMFLANLGGKLAYLLLKGSVADLKHQMDSEEYGGAPFLGAKQPVIKAHGSSKAKGIKNAIRQAKICVENDLCGTMQSALDELAAAQKTEE